MRSTDSGGAVGDTAEWWSVCAVSDLEPGRGATALVHGQALAIFLLADGTVLALGNHDPFDPTGSLARGVVGERAGTAFVGSPSHGHAFDLRTGVCLDHTAVHVPVYAVRVREGTVEVGSRIRESVT